MAPLRSHLTVLSAACSKYAASPAFWIPAAPGTSPRSWSQISYKQFYEDVELAARSWHKVLGGAGLSRGDIVGFWAGGLSYADVAAFYGLSLAGYIPQLISMRLSSGTVVLELLQASGAKALVYDPTYTLPGDAASWPLPTSPILPVAELKQFSAAPLPEFPEPSSPESPVMIFHTSGSTGGCPKLVPYSATLLDNVVSKIHRVAKPADAGRRDVCTWMGSICHLAQNTIFLGSMQHGASTIQPTTLPISGDEAKQLVKHCSLNRLHMFDLGPLIRASKTDAALLSCLKGMDAVFYGGLALASEEAAFGYSHGIKIQNCFASTEVNIMMTSSLTSPVLRPLPDTNYVFLPADGNAGLVELAVHPSSPDYPALYVASRGQSTAEPYRTGDLFSRTDDGGYVSRGRSDNWIKTANALRCDCGAIEAAVMSRCADVVRACIALGQGRASPVLLLEPMGVEMEVGLLKTQVLARLEEWNSRRYVHERLNGENFVVVLPSGALPRTAAKGNVQRALAEAKFKTILDEIYAAA